MKILVTGASGFLGINLIRFLLKRRQEVVGLDIAPFDYPEKDQLDWFYRGDIRDPDLIARAVNTHGEPCDVVVHCAAALPLQNKDEIFSVETTGTLNCILRAREAGVKQFVHISSTAVYGIPDHHPLYETDKLTGVGPYGEAKIAAEEIVEGYRGTIMAPILRPKTFIGPERLGVFAMLYQWASEKRGFPIIGEGRNKYQYLDVEDLCQAIWSCITGGANDTYNIGAEEYGTFKEDIQGLLDYAGFGRKVVCIPEWLAVPGLKVLEKLKLSPLYRWVYETAGRESFVSIEKAQRELGFKPKYSNQAALRRNYDWFLTNRWRLKEGKDHRSAWKQGALGLIKYLF